MAVKQIQRSLQRSTVTRAEYELLATLRHAHLPRALALFVHAPDSATDSIVMELYAIFLEYKLIFSAN